MQNGAGAGSTRSIQKMTLILSTLQYAALAAFPCKLANKLQNKFPYYAVENLNLNFSYNFSPEFILSLSLSSSLSIPTLGIVA